MNQTVQHRAGGARQIVRHLFVREVDLGLDERQGVEEIAAEAGVGFAQPPVELAQGLFRLGGRLGVDQVGYGLGLGQIHSAVLEGPARELARFSRPDAQRDQGAAGGLHHRPTAM